MTKDLYINGQWQIGEGNDLSSLCPVKQTPIAMFRQATTQQAQLAVSSAANAFEAWSELELDSRIQYLEKYVSALKNNHQELALAISQEVGKPLWESRTEVAAMINKVAISIEAYHERTPFKDQGGTRLAHRPHGVMLVLGPYNFPGHLPNGHIVPALLAGNTVVFKPSEQTPLVAQKMMELWHQAALPPGVLNLIQGDGLIGKALLDMAIDGVLFTGSYGTGKKIHSHFAGRPEIILALEMGGNNPLVISEVKNMQGAVFNTIMSAFITAGQRCTCARRVLVPNTIWGDEFIQSLVSRTSHINVGHYSQQPEPFMGPVINLETAENLLKTQQQWVQLGAESILSMSAGEGALLTPGIIDVTSVKDQIADSEFFGPMLQLIKYNTIEEGIQIANKTAYGLSAGLISDQTQEHELFYKKIRAGIVNINKQLTGASSNAPFGGIGHSGNHRPSAYYSADFCAYPMASMFAESAELLETLPNGLNWD